MQLRNSSATSLAIPILTLLCLCAHPQWTRAQQGFFQVEKLAGGWSSCPKTRSKHGLGTKSSTLTQGAPGAGAVERDYGQRHLH